MRERFTLVLKGHIAIATARFPKGTRGVDLDPFARRALWEAGLDFDHGTGHGVGSYLSVHEGPQSISKRGMAALEPGMIISNEPGYYKTGAYGIRIENLVLVTEPEKLAGGEREMMGFETLTLAPIDRRLVVAELLSAGGAGLARRLSRARARDHRPGARAGRPRLAGAGEDRAVIPACRVGDTRDQSQLRWARIFASRVTWRQLKPSFSTRCRNASSASSTAMMVSALGGSRGPRRRTRDARRRCRALQLFVDEARLLGRHDLVLEALEQDHRAVMPSIRLSGERVANTSFHFAGVVPSRRCR